MLAKTVEYRAGVVYHKAVVCEDMFADALQIFTIYVQKRTAFDAFQVEMGVTVLRLGLRTRILPAGSAALIEGIAAHQSLRFQTFQCAVDGCSTNRRTVFGEGLYKLCSGQVRICVLFKIF